MATDQQSAVRISRMKMTAISVALITAISVCFITFKSNTHSTVKTTTSTPKVKSGIVSIAASENPEVLTNMLPVISIQAPKPEHHSIANFINPPLPEILPESVVATFEPATGGTVECSSGSFAHIPPNAFVDASGKPVDKPVKVVFTEYRDYKDIFFSGIPMNIQSDDKQKQLESAGMMQLEASADNKAVYVSAESKIKVMLASNTSRTDYNLYFFDKKKGEWKEKGKDQVVYKKKELKKSVTAKTMYAYKPQERSVYIASFEGVLEEKVFLWWRSPAKEFDFSFIRISKSFPELKNLSGMQWEYRGSDARDVYSKLFNIPAREKNQAARRGNWQSYTAEMNPETITATITLVNDGGSMTFDIRPKDKSEKNLLKAKKRMEKYNEGLVKRLQTDSILYARYQRDSIAYSYPLEAANAIKMDVMRSFSIDNMGVWNVDRILKDDNFVTYNLKFVDEDNNPIEADEVFLVDKNYNSVFRFTDKDNKIRLNPYSENMIWIVLPGNKLAHAGQHEVWKLAGKKGKQKVTMKISEDAIASIENAREELNF